LEALRDIRWGWGEGWWASRAAVINVIFLDMHRAAQRHEIVLTHKHTHINIYIYIYLCVCHDAHPST
jgi:hypothetical protein